MKSIAALLCILALSFGVAQASAPAALVGDPYQILEVGLTNAGTIEGAVDCDNGTATATGNVVLFVPRGDPSDVEHKVLVEAIVNGHVRSAMTFESGSYTPAALYNVTAQGVIRSIISDPANSDQDPCGYLLGELGSK